MRPGASTLKGKIDEFDFVIQNRFEDRLHKFELAEHESKVFNVVRLNGP